MVPVERVAPLASEAGDDVLLARRLRIAITLCVAPILLYAIFDLALLPRDELPLYWALKGAALLVWLIPLALAAGHGWAMYFHWTDRYHV
jgi:hypothetical protein